MSNRSTPATATREEYNLYLEELRKELLWATIYFDITEQLWHTKEVIDVINQYRGFFIPVKQVLFDQFTIKICNVTNRRDPNAPSFYRIFGMIATNSIFAPRVDIRLQRKRINQHSEVLNNIMHHRKTQAAHWDVSLRAKSRPIVARSKPILFGKTKELLKDLHDIFNVVYTSDGKNPWSFKPAEHSNATGVLVHLQK